VVLVTSVLETVVDGAVVTELEVETLVYTVVALVVEGPEVTDVVLKLEVPVVELVVELVVKKLDVALVD